MLSSSSEALTYIYLEISDSNRRSLSQQEPSGAERETQLTNTKRWVTIPQQTPAAATTICALTEQRRARRRSPVEDSIE